MHSLLGGNNVKNCCKEWMLRAVDKRDRDAQQGFYANKDSSACVIEKRSESS